MKKLTKIRLIEEPRSEEVIQQELEEVLGGWNCGSYNDGWFFDRCNQWNQGTCNTDRSSHDFCGTYTSGIW